ncbi:ApeA N-terminal domain 1-containing protein [Paenibacillus sp. FSL R10-2788]|uniref:ApeA N-terminal domain 1-containing protein n=1 Tax=Paenibacillus sp. FSL R10-2788 TaxID=2954694 RepID=UPI0030FB794E
MSKYPKMYDTFEYPGVWWIAGEEGNKVGGVLKFTVNDILLELNGEGINILNFRSDVQRLAVIHGNCLEGAITLLDGFPHNQQTKYSTGKSNPHSILTLSFTRLLIGEHYQNLQDIVFPELSFEFSNFNEWINFSPIEVEHLEKGIQISVKTFETVESYVNDINAKITFTYTFGNSGENFSYQQLYYKNFITIQPDSPQSLEWYEKVAKKFKDLLSILTDTNIFMEYVEHSTIEKRIRYYRTSFNDYMKVKISPYRGFLIPFTMIKDDIEDILNKWYSLNINSSALTYVNIIANSKYMFVEDIFLGYSKALESAHRNSFSENNKFVAEDVYNQIKGKMLSAIKIEAPGNLYNKLVSTLQYANEFGFQRRIQEIIKSLDPKIKDIVLMGLEVRDFADIVRINRDYNTHFGEISDKLFSPHQFMSINESLKLIMLNTILRQIGISDDLLWTILNFNKNWIGYLNNSKELFENNK